MWINRELNKSIDCHTEKYVIYTYIDIREFYVNVRCDFQETGGRELLRIKSNTQYIYIWGGCLQWLIIIIILLKYANLVVSLLLKYLMRYDSARLKCRMKCVGKAIVTETVDGVERFMQWKNKINTKRYFSRYSTIKTVHKNIKNG